MDENCESEPPLSELPAVWASDLRDELNLLSEITQQVVGQVEANPHNFDPSEIEDLQAAGNTFAEISALSGALGAKLLRITSELMQSPPSKPIDSPPQTIREQAEQGTLQLTTISNILFSPHPDTKEWRQARDTIINHLRAHLHDAMGLLNHGVQKGLIPSKELTDLRKIQPKQARHQQALDRLEQLVTQPLSQKDLPKK